MKLARRRKVAWHWKDLCACVCEKSDSEKRKDDASMFSRFTFLLCVKESSFFWSWRMWISDLLPCMYTMSHSYAWLNDLRDNSARSYTLVTFIDVWQQLSMWWAVYEKEEFCYIVYTFSFRSKQRYQLACVSELAYADMTVDNNRWYWARWCSICKRSSVSGTEKEQNTDKHIIQSVLQVNFLGVEAKQKSGDFGQVRCCTRVTKETTAMN